MSEAADQPALHPTEGRVVDSSVLDSTSRKDDSHVSVNGDTVSGSGRITLRDLKKVIETDNRFSEVTEEQIERVKMMHDIFMDGAVFDFNYNTLLLVASVIAGLGLVSNSTASIIASMLVSPIMGPVVAIGYGTTILDRNMVKVALRTELISLLVCIIVGIIIGACTGWTKLAESWPTPEMITRCTISNLLVGIPVAFFSGLGVAVSLLDSQTNSLVGVAISASLLPPAVNCGIVLMSWYFVDKEQFSRTVTYAQWVEYAWVSLALTLVNIAMIWISSILMFRLKEVLPIKKKIFWSDLGIARKIYQGKAVLAHQAFDPEVQETPEDNERRRYLWDVVRTSLPKLREAAPADQES